jgi:KDO2-lipid IV(A) lauroyltransferase
MAFLASGDYRRRFLENLGFAGLGRGPWWAAVGESGRLIAELPRLWMGRPVPVFWDGADHVEAALAQARGIVFLTPHLGCFEVAAQAYAARYGVMGQPMTVLFRPPRKAWLQEVVMQSRQRPGLATASTTLAGVKQLIKALKSGQCVGLLPDQVPPEGLGVWAPFFGKPAYTMTLSARLALQTGATVLVAWGERLPWGRGYVVHVLPLQGTLSADMTEAATQINGAMEQLILQKPQQYLWGYARYKIPKADGV